MIKNNLKIAWRSLRKHPASSFINIGGLSVGMAVAILIGLWIYDELSFDKNFKHYDQIAQVGQHSINNGEIQTGTTLPYPVGDLLRKNFGSDFKQVTMASWNESHILSFGEKRISNAGSFLEPSALDLLSVNMIGGTKASLADPGSILLSETTAKAYFGSTDPLGRVMKIDNKTVVTVTGVYTDFPRNSSFSDVSFIAPWTLFADLRGLKSMTDPWRCNCFMVYTQLADKAAMEKVSAKIKDLKLQFINKSELSQKPQLFLYPMSKWHLYSEFSNGVISGGRIRYVWMFGIIGFFVLMLACINFMNLSTARSEKRAKEVGIRKAVGSLRSQLMVQFFVESLLVSFFAFLLSVLLVQMALPLFNDLSGKQMVLLWRSPVFWLAGFAFGLFTGLLAGSYPALYLSAFKPVKVLKGTFKAGRFAAVPRKVLVVLQFTVSVVLITGTLIVFRQIQFAQNRPIGYTRDGLVSLQMSSNDIHDHFSVVKNELLNTGKIVSVAEAGSPTTAVWSTNSGFDWKGKDPGEAVEFPNTEVSYDYAKTVGWQFVGGRGFSNDYATDSTAFVINETAAKFIGMKNPVGEILKWDGVPFTIIGVIKDMVTESPYDMVRPSLYHLANYSLGVVIVKISPQASASEALAKIETVFKKYNPGQPFEYQFVNDAYNRKFNTEQRVGKLAFFFAALAIFISCLGLFGMASFVAEQRTKEIGLRKILGCTVFGLWQLLSKEFMLLVVIALVIATPAAYFFMHNWLQQYAYRTRIPWWIFAVSGAGAMVITILTVSYQAIRAAVANPVKSLRTE